MANCSTRLDFWFEQIIKQSRWGEIIVHENFVVQSLNSSNNLQHCFVRCCYLSCGMRARHYIYLTFGHWGVQAALAPPTHPGTLDGS